MSRFKQQGFAGTFRNARKGLRLAIRAEKNIRIHFCVGLLVLVFGAYLQFNEIKMYILLLTIGMVITTEMINSAIEFSLDAVFHNRYSRLVGFAKDISAGAVMFVTVIAILIGLHLFVPAIVQNFVS